MERVLQREYATQNRPETETQCWRSAENQPLKTGQNGNPRPNPMRISSPAQSEIGRLSPIYNSFNTQHPSANAMNTEPWVTAETEKEAGRRPVLVIECKTDTSGYPMFTPKKDKLRAAYLHHPLRAAHFESYLQRKASGTSGRKHVTPAGFLSLEIPVPSLDEQDKLIAGFTPANEMGREAARLRQSAWAAFESALFTPAEPSAT